MQTDYHRTITVKALESFFSAAALEDVIAANLGQDHWLKGQLGHPEYHFDANSFVKSQAYIDRNRAEILPALEKGDALVARQAFGRLTHAAQDLYAHSNYTALWFRRFEKQGKPPAEDIDPMDTNILNDPALHSGKVIPPLDGLMTVPFLKRLILPFMPADTHAKMNLDAPERGYLFEYAFAAAVKRTRIEYKLAAGNLEQGLLALFCDRPSPFSNPNSSPSREV